VYRSLGRRERINQLLVHQPEERISIDLAIDIGRVLNRCRPGDRDLLEQHLNGVTTTEMARKKSATETSIRIRMLRARRDLARESNQRNSLRRCPATCTWRRSRMPLEKF
jgi:hypothetical protein